MSNVIIMKTIIEKEFEQHNIEIHIKIKQRNGRKSWTSIEGLDKLEPNRDKLDTFIENIAKNLKKKFSCGASIEKPEYIVQLNGDHREGIKDFLIKGGFVNETQIKMHGF